MDIYSTTIHNCQNLEARCPIVGKWINCGKLRQWKIIQGYKEMSYQGIKRHGRILNSYYYI